MILDMNIKRIETTARVSHDFPLVDFSRIPGFPNRLISERTSTPLPVFWGDDNVHSSKFHVMIFLSHMSKYNI